MPKQKFPIVTGQRLGYWLQTPDVVAPGKQKTIIDLHGVGGFGPGYENTLDSLMIGPPSPPSPSTGAWSETPQDLQVMANKAGIQLIAPQTGSNWTEADINWMIDTAINKHNADPSNIVITGFSLGGGGVTLFITSQSSTRVKAAVSCNGLNWGTNWSRANMLVWFFHTENDQRVSVTNTRNAVASMKAVGLNPRVTYDASGGHTYNNFYKNPELYAWMFGIAVEPPVTLPPPSSVLKANAGPDLTVNTNTFELDGTASTGYGQAGWMVKSGPGKYWNIAVGGWSGIKQKLQNLENGDYIFDLWVQDDSGRQLIDTMNLTVAIGGTVTPPPPKVVFATAAVPAGSQSVTVYEDKTFEFK